jgi:hypothetical protein
MYSKVRHCGVFKQRHCESFNCVISTYSKLRRTRNCVIFESSSCVISTGASPLLAMRSGETAVFGIYPASTVPNAIGAQRQRCPTQRCRRQQWPRKRNTGVSPLAPLGRDDTSKAVAHFYEMTLQSCCALLRDDTSKLLRTLAAAHFEKPVANIRREISGAK